VDVFFSPDGHLSTRLKEIPSIPVIHDINFHHNPRSVPFWHGSFWRYYFPKYAKLASRILTVSEYSKKDISDYYNIPTSKIDVAYNAANDNFSPIDEAEKKEIKNEIAEGEDYFIYVGVLVPRKNICRMIQGFEKFKKSTNRKTKLVIVGDSIYFTSEMKKVYNMSPVKDEIIFTGRLEENRMIKIMGAALSLILVSTYEGFGIPVIEAMKSHVPVITSNISSLPEVAGEAALITDPFSIDSIANAMIKIDENEKFREELILKGSHQCKKFNWDTTAIKVWDCIQKVVNN
jgi:glycosyltransferase involved in cell wall biosynthesis